MVDQALLAIARAAEAGADLPGICMFTGSLSIFGIPISSVEAQGLMKQTMADSLLQSQSRLRRRKDPVANEALQTAEEYLARFGSGVVANDGGISLKDAVLVITPTSERISVPTARVSLDSVASWFVGDFKSSGGGRSSFVGFVAFPTN